MEEYDKGEEGNGRRKLSRKNRCKKGKEEEKKRLQIGRNKEECKVETKVKKYKY